MRVNNITLNVLVNGNFVTEYTKNNNIYIQGRKGSTYTLRITNHTNERVLVIPSIDGLSILDGKPAGYESQGYVLGAFQTYNADGWRTDLDHTRQFQFTRHNKSYAGKTGQDKSNLGAIGLVAFKAEPTIQFTNWNIDYHPPVTYPKRRTSDYDGHWGAPIGYSLDSYSGIATGSLTGSSTGSLPQNAVAESSSREPAQVMAVSSIGTGMGAKQESHVSTTSFNRQTNPFATIVVYYYERKQLENMGVIHKVNHQMPQAFPNQFCAEV